MPGSVDSAASVLIGSLYAAIPRRTRAIRAWDASQDMSWSHTTFLVSTVYRASARARRLHSARRMMKLRWMCALAVAGCGGSAPESATERVWQPLVEGAWELEPASESYWCATNTIERDMYIGAFRPLAPNGTHHTLLSETPGAGSGADIGYPCGPGTLGQRLIYGTGIGGGDFVLPKGVAMHVAAGTQLHLNLHLFNAGTATITGRSGALVELASPESVEHLAGAILA